MVQAKPNALRTDLGNKRKVNKECNAKQWQSCKNRAKMNPWWNSISYVIDVSMELDADFNFPTIHLMSHWVKLIS